MLNFSAFAVHLREALGAVQVIAFVAPPACGVVLALDAGNHHPGPLVRAFEELVVAM